MWSAWQIIIFHGQVVYDSIIHLYPVLIKTHQQQRKEQSWFKDVHKFYMPWLMDFYFHLLKMIEYGWFCSSAIISLLFCKWHIIRHSVLQLQALNLMCHLQSSISYNLECVTNARPISTVEEMKILLQKNHTIYMIMWETCLQSGKIEICVL